MTSLRELQHAFLDGALYGYPGRIADLIVENGIPADRRLGIYANNARAGFLAALEATFPVLVQLAGEDWFGQTARQYMRQHPSRAGNLHYVGERFADYLDHSLQASDYAYFADVARLEWAYQEVLIAPEHPSFEIGALANVAPADYELLRFEVHPAVRLVESHFPILAIWKANQKDAPANADPIDLTSGVSRVLLIRRDDHVELREMPPGPFALLQAFARGQTFGEAAEAALIAEPGLDLGGALAQVVRLNTLVDFTTATAQSTIAEGASS
jgi:hypothetical protein